MSTYYIGITVRQEGGAWAAIPSRSAPPIICGNPDAFGFTITFEGEWPDSDPAFARRTLRIVAISQEGEMHEYSTYSELSNNLTLDFPIHDAVRCMVYVTRGDRTTEIPAAIRCLPGITDNSGIEDNPRPDVYNLMCEYIAQRRGGSQSAADALLDTLYELRETAPPAYPGDDYRLTAKRSERVTTVTGTLTLASGRTIQITDDMIASDTLKIQSTAISGDALIPGGVPSAELQITLRLGDVAKGDIYEARLVLAYHIQRSDEHWCEIPLGAYTATEAKNPKPGYMQITAYDDMLKFTRMLRDDFPLIPWRDRDYPFAEAVATFAEAAGVAWDGVIPESYYEWYEYPGIDPNKLNTGIETARDLIGFIAQAVGAIAWIDPHGSILRLTRPSVLDPVESYTEGDSLSHNVSGLEYRTHVVRVTAQDYNGYTGEYGGAVVREGYTLWDFGVVAELPENLLASACRYGGEGAPELGGNFLSMAVETLDPVVFTPGEVETYGDPSLRPLEWIEVRTETGDAQFPITRTEWRYRGTHKIESGGEETISGMEKSMAEKRSLGTRIEMWSSTVNEGRRIILMFIQTGGHSGMSDETHATLHHFTHKELGTKGEW